MITRKGKLVNVAVGSKFMKDCHVYLRVKDMNFNNDYPDAITAVNLDTYEIVIIHEAYEVDEIVENEEIDYE